MKCPKCKGTGKIKPLTKTQRKQRDRMWKIIIKDLKETDWYKKELKPKEK